MARQVVGQRWFSWAALLAGAGIGIFMALVFSAFGDQARVQRFELAVTLPDPESVQEAVDISDAIVVATLQGQPYEAEEYSYRNTETPISSVAAPNEPQPRAFPFTYYNLRIKEVILDDGIVRANPILRIMGSVASDYSFSGIRMPQPGEQYFFFLSRNKRDDASYGILGAWSMIDMTNRTIAQADQSRSVPGFVHTRRPADFMGTVSHAVSLRSPVGVAELFR